MPASRRPASALVSVLGVVDDAATPQPVYNLTVEGEHEFFANGVLVHNCTWEPGRASPDRLDALVYAVLDSLPLLQHGEPALPQAAPSPDDWTQRYKARLLQQIRDPDGYDSPDPEDDD